MTTGDVETVCNKILMSGVDDWVHIPEAVSFARDALPESDEQTALPLAVESVKQLLREGLVQVGKVTNNGFEPWLGSLDVTERRIDEAAAKATFPLLFGDLFWICNTALGDERGGGLLKAMSQQ